MQYVALFHKEKNGFGVTFPDFPECTTFGENLDEAVDQAHEALALYLELYQEKGQQLPDPTGKKVAMGLPESKGAKVINVSVAGDGSDFEEFEVTMHSHLLSRIEKYCREYGASPADFLASAAREGIKSDIFAD
jgi:predicted RNase H-like HicB family nuclease